MAYVITATLSNGKHPENGSTQILFPLSRQEYSDAIGHLKELEAGDAVARDCVVEEIDSGYEVLGCLEGKAVNVDELDFLAKRLDSFDEYEAQQFQAACHAFGCRDIQSLINMTFCCQETTVIGDFSKLEEAGKHHYLTTHGGAAPAEEMERVDGKAVAEELFRSKKGVLTPYGLFFCNKVGRDRLEAPYRGMGIPLYLWERPLAEVELTDKSGSAAFTFLPTSELALTRFCQRNDVQLSETTPAKLTWLIGSREPVRLTGGAAELTEYNELAERMNDLSETQQSAFLAAVEATGAEELSQMWPLLEHVRDFTFCPGVESAEDYGRYMIQQSGAFDYDDRLEPYYNYEALGEFLLVREYGQFTRGGYLRCAEESAFADFFPPPGHQGDRAQERGEMTMKMEGM